MSSAQSSNHPFHRRPPLWVYHELAPHQWKRAEYLNLCLETVQKHCGRQFRVIPLTRYNIYKYVPDLRKDFWHRLTYHQRMDWMKWELLSRYGGLVLDANVLVLRDLTPHTNKLADHDFVAFGRHGVHSPQKADDPHQTTVSLPLTWAMASRPRGQLATLARQRCHWLLNNKPDTVLQDGHRHLRTGTTATASGSLFGAQMLWTCMAMLHQPHNTHSTHSTHSTHNTMSTGTSHPPTWKYFHVDSRCAESDASNGPYTPDRLLSNEVVDPACAHRMHLLPLGDTDTNTSASSGSHNFPTWFRMASRERLLGNGQMLVSRLWRWSLLGEEVPNSAQQVSAVSSIYSQDAPAAQQHADQYHYGYMPREVPTVHMPRFYASGWDS